MAFLGIRYATFEAGPHEKLPNVCTAMSGPTIKAVVGNAAFEQRKIDADDGGYPVQGCTWQADKTPTRTQVNIEATLFTRSLWSSSTDKAREAYQQEWGTQGGYTNRGSPATAVTPLNGVGNEGFCAAKDMGAAVLYRCWARDGNVEITLWFLPSSGASGEELTHDQLFRLVDKFRDTARELANDVIDDL